ncbi:MAG TPA: tRNA lysidine(34) synthetase TilS [Terriglobales bacterium]|nr:tRNA lysidine(34) synthetase TilS [Terriglobales bacterium]
MLRSLHDYIKRHALLKPGDRVGVAVSGGADSVALLRWFLDFRAELGVVLSVVHFNHNLRGDESRGDEQFVSDLARNFDLPFHRAEADTRTYAREKELSIEAAARELRYKFFGTLIKDGMLDKVGTAHTLDDQAETVLLRIFRGTGTSGLAGILPKLKVGNGAIIRPLLSTRRADVLQHLAEWNQTWREDSTNTETTFTRNRVRHQLIPFLEQSFNPEIDEALSNLAEIARAEDEFWSAQTADAFMKCFRNGALLIDELLKLPVALQRRVLRLAAMQRGAQLDFLHSERILDLVTSKSREQRIVELPNSFRAILSANDLRFETAAAQAKNCGYSYNLPIPGEVAIPELRILLRAKVVTDAATPTDYNGDRRLALDQLASHLVVRNWRPGDRFWPAHTRSEKKVKELLQERHLASREKSLWPVAVSGESIVWMRGFPVSSTLAARGGVAVEIEELPLSPDA